MWLRREGSLRTGVHFLRERAQEVSLAKGGGRAHSLNFPVLELMKLSTPYFLTTSRTNRIAAPQLSQRKD